jgi:formyltetrahydrofolate hydrolase
VPEFVLTLSCPDRTGLAYAVAHWLFERDCNILDSDQFVLIMVSKFDHCLLDLLYRWSEG